jgi:hypothetical protein
MQNLNRSPKASNPLPSALSVTLVAELELTWEEEISSLQFSAGNEGKSRAFLTP